MNIDRAQQIVEEAIKQEENNLMTDIKISLTGLTLEAKLVALDELYSSIYGEGYRNGEGTRGYTRLVPRDETVTHQIMVGVARGNNENPT